MKGENHPPYLEHALMMIRLTKFKRPYFLPIHYLAILILEETGNLTPSLEEIVAIESAIKSKLAIKDTLCWEHNLKYEDAMDLLAREVYFCPINYLALILLEHTVTIDFDIDALEKMENWIRAVLAKIKEEETLSP
jgi:hypothetical protein